MTMYIKPDGFVKGSLSNPINSIERQKELQKSLGYGKRAEPNMIIDSKEEVIDTIAKKDFDKTSLIQKTCVNCPPSYLFRIKKGDPIQVIKTTKVGTLQTDVFYDLRKHNGQNYAKTIAETPKQPIKDNSNFKDWANSGFIFNISSLGSFFSEYNIPKDVVEEPTIIEKAKEIVSVSPSDTIEKKYNKNLIKFALIGLAGYVAYRLIKK